MKRFAMFLMLISAMTFTVGCSGETKVEGGKKPANADAKDKDGKDKDAKGKDAKDKDAKDKDAK